MTFHQTPQPSVFFSYLFFFSLWLDLHSQTENLSIMADRHSWQSTTQRKRDALDALLPADFRPDNVPSAEEQRDVTQYIQQFLSASERDITENHSAGALVGKLASGDVTATDVTRAFCHRATIAHQLVSPRNPRREDMSLMLTFMAGQLSQ